MTRKNKLPPEYDWFGVTKKNTKQVSFLGLGITPKKQKLPSKINYMGKPNPNLKMKPSPLFVKESIKKGRKGLSKWGDADLDGTPNYFDCDPVNWMKDARPIKNIFKTGQRAKEKFQEYVKGKRAEAKEKYSRENLNKIFEKTYENLAMGSTSNEKERKKTRLAEGERSIEKHEKYIQRIKNKLAEDGLSDSEQTSLKKLLKESKKTTKILESRQGVEKSYDRFRKAMSLSGPAGKVATKQLAVDLKIEAGKPVSQKQVAALLAAEKKTKFLGKEGYGRRLAQGVPGLAQVEGVVSALGGYGLGEGGVYTKAMRAKSARVRRLTQVATGQVFGSALTSGGFATSEPRGRGRPAGPTGEYKIGGKPVYEEEFRQWEIKQRSLNSMLPSQQQSQTLNPEYVAQQKALEVERFKQDQIRAQMVQDQPLENMRDVNTGETDKTMTEPIPSDQAPQTEGMTNEQVQAIEEARRRPYTRSSMEEIRQAQQMAQKQDQILNAPNFMKGELKAAGGSILTATGPQIMDAPNAFKGELRNVNKMEGEEGMPSVRLSERPQTNPYGSEFLEIELGSGKPVVRNRIREKWVTGEAL